MGLDRAAPFYYGPGFHAPNGSAEALVNAEALASLPEALRGLVETACEAENNRGLAEAEWYNAQALQSLEASGTEVLRFPDDLLLAARGEAEQVLEAVASEDALSGRILDSYRAARTAAAAWGRVSRHALLGIQLEA